MTLIGDLPKAIRFLVTRNAVQKVINLQRVRTDPEIAMSPAYQRAYNGYYRVSRKSEAFYRAYYSLLYSCAESKNRSDMLTILYSIYSDTKERHLSFSSKLFATLDDSAVIYDRNVAALCGVVSTALPNGEDWINEAMRRYHIIERKIVQEINSDAWSEIRTAFDQVFPYGSNLSDTRKADLLVWASY